MKTLLFCFTITALSSSAFAEMWSYDPVTPENNTRESISTMYVTDTIDTSEGELTVIGEIKNFGTGSGFNIGGSYNLNAGKITNQYGTIILYDASLNSTGSIMNQYGSLFEVNGNSFQRGDGNVEFQQNSTLSLTDYANFNVKGNIVLYWNANIKLAYNSVLSVNQISSLYEEGTGFSITLDEGAQIVTQGGTVSAKSITLAKNAKITGNVSTSGSLVLGEGNTISGNITAADLVLNEGASVGGTVSASNSLTLNGNTSAYLGVYPALKGTCNLNNVGGKAITSDVELKWADAGATLNIALGNNSLSANNRDNAIVWTQYGKDMTEGSSINISLSDFILDDIFVEGQTYEIALICSRYQSVEAWMENINLIDDSSIADFVEDSLVWKDNAIWVSVTAAVPEPAACAAIFGALALAFAAYRKRK